MAKTICPGCQSESTSAQQCSYCGAAIAESKAAPSLSFLSTYAESEPVKTDMTPLIGETINQRIIHEVVLTDIQMPFAAIFEFVMRWALASILVTIILGIAGVMIAGLVWLIVAAIVSAIAQ